MKTPVEVKQKLAELSRSVWALSTVASAVEGGIVELLKQPQSAADIHEGTGIPTPMAQGILEVLVSLGFVRREGDKFIAEPGFATMVERPGRDWLLADTRTTLRQAAIFVENAKRNALALDGWRHTDPELLQAQGTLSAEGAEPVAKLLIPALGLDDKISAPGFRVLDVGCGVAGFAIALCRKWPTVHVVGLEPAPAPLALARKNVVEAGLTPRINLREQRVEDVQDEEAFDLVHLPAVFLPRPVFTTALPTLLRAMRTGGVLTTATMSAPGGGLDFSLGRLRNLLWGGDVLTAEDAESMMKEAGFRDVRRVPLPSAGTFAVLTGRK